MSEDRDLASVWEARRLVRRAAAAQTVLESFTQENIDRIVQAMAQAAEAKSKYLAQLACEETGFGNPEDKHLKNSIAFKHVYEYIRDMRTVGVLNHDREKKIVEIAAPVGVVAAIVPSTNPTSTTIYKILIAVKARNSIVISPHPSAKKCIAETASVLFEAGKVAGLPPDSILCMNDVTLEGTKELMSARETGVVLATGNMGLVKSAYSSGKPAFGVGPGNVPAYVHTSASIPKAANDIIAGKSFDYGTICASEQSVVADREIAGQLREEMTKRGACFLSKEEAGKVEKVLILAGRHPSVNPKLVGKSAPVIAAAAGISVPENTRCLVAELETVGPEAPLSIEKLSPVLSFYQVSDWREGCEKCKEILAFGGMGHTLAVHSQSEEIILSFGLEKPAYRICVNTPATHGAVGYSTSLAPSMTLGCGAAGNNITSDNITPKHLMDIKRVAYGIREVPLSESTVAAPAVISGADTTEKIKEVKREDVEMLVDRFLAAKAISSTPWETKKDTETCRTGLCETSATSTASPQLRTVDQEQSRRQPAPEAVDFVCEFDVRQAFNNGDSIVVNGKTIITPSAREYGEREGVFIYRDESNEK